MVKIHPSVVVTVCVWFSIYCRVIYRVSQKKCNKMCFLISHYKYKEIDDLWQYVKIDKHFSFNLILVDMLAFRTHRAIIV
jgi:hypothetical protein